MKKNSAITIPKDGFIGLKENLLSDLSSGFTVFLLALPLSLGIAKASEFPPVMGLVTAIIGGIVVSFFMGAKLTIKGPAAGLIVIAAGAVHDFGGGTDGWKLALATIFVAGLIQILFGVLKLGRLVDFFPLSTIHGMLAAIGIIIVSKQIPILLNVPAAMSRGKGPIELITSIPNFIGNLDPKSTIIGLVSLAIMLLWKYIKVEFIQKIPAPLVVLLFAIPAQHFIHFSNVSASDSLVQIGRFVDSIGINVDFSAYSQWAIFWKYVAMFAIVGSLESLLTVKAVDIMDPYKRKSDTNKDLIAIGIGNTLAAVIGGLPMISEVARSSANVNNGAKTRWSNFFHGLFILIFVLLATQVIELIPNTALAAMLITVGIQLAHPRKFVQIFKIGKRRFLVFLTTIVFTLYQDLLVGIGAGILLKMTIHLINGTPIRSFFNAPTVVSFVDNSYLVEIDKSAIFSNFLGIKRKLDSIPLGFDVTIDLSKTHIVDDSVMENLLNFQQAYRSTGGTLEIIGLEGHHTSSDHELAIRKKPKK